MTKEKLAEILNGRAYREEITEQEEKLAEQSGLIVVFPYSDDNIEFRGAIDDELGCYGDHEFFLKRDRVLESTHGCECEFCGYGEATKNAKILEAIWDGSGKEGTLAWQYRINAPYAKFEIRDEGVPWAMGIVIDQKDLPK